MDKKQIINKILHQHLDVDKNTDYTNYKQLIGSLNDLMDAECHKWFKVSEKPPNHNKEIFAKSPDYSIHLTNWREEYKIFTCQNKYENSDDWFWREIN